MSEPRRQRRPISSSAPVAPAASSTGSAILDVAISEPLQAYLETLRDFARMKQYRLLGRLSRVQIIGPAGPKVLDFRKDGPVIGFAIPGEQPIVISEWRGLPAKWDDTDTPCSACLAKCDVCDGTGQKLCEAPQCGGSGKAKLPYGPCTAGDCLAGGQDLTRRPKADCPLCKGTGHYAPTKNCDVCKGSGKMACSACRATGKRPTGITGGSTNWRLPACATCQGSRFAHTEIPQNIADFVSTRIGPMVALGPIVRFVVESVGGDGTPPQVFDVDADANGQHMVILLESEEPGAGAFLLGGVLRPMTIGVS